MADGTYGTPPLRLVLFDVDGTLADSQQAITSAMTEAFEAVGVAAPSRAQILSIVGLSLPLAMAELAPAASPALQHDLIEAYKRIFKAARIAHGAAHSPLYPGARETLAALHEVPEYLLGVATGKTLRGLNGLTEAHGLNCFVTRQVADHHPSKPHPSMILTALAETGVEPENAVMIGDTSFDMDMARAAGVTAIAVDWGYHPAEQLDADYILSSFDELMPLLARIWKA